MSTRRAVVVGIGTYDDPGLNQLDAPQSDIDSLAAVLLDKEIGRFDDVKVLHDVGVEPMRRQLARAFREADHDDMLLVYFSGHGILDDMGRLYLAAADTERAFASATALPASFLTDELERCLASQQVLVLDCCHSGAFARGAKAVVGDTVGTGTQFRPSGKGRFVLTATDATQYAWEGDTVTGSPMPSVFTECLVRGLRSGEADLDGDGLVTVDELYEFLHREVSASTPKQTPKKWSFNQQGDVIMGWIPSTAVVTTPLPTEILDAIGSGLPRVRHEAIRELLRLAAGRHRGLAASAVNSLQALAEDDSKMVSAAAAAALAEVHGLASPPTPQVSEVVPPASQISEDELVAKDVSPPSTTAAREPEVLVSIEDDAPVETVAATAVPNRNTESQTELEGDPKREPSLVGRGRLVLAAACSLVAAGFMWTRRTDFVASHGELLWGPRLTSVCLVIVAVVALIAGLRRSSQYRLVTNAAALGVMAVVAAAEVAFYYRTEDIFYSIADTKDRDVISGVLTILVAVLSASEVVSGSRSNTWAASSRPRYATVTVVALVAASFLVKIRYGLGFWGAGINHLADVAFIAGLAILLLAATKVATRSVANIALAGVSLQLGLGMLWIDGSADGQRWDIGSLVPMAAMIAILVVVDGRLLRRFVARPAAS